MSRFVQRVIAFLDPRPSAEFRSRMHDSRERAHREAAEAKDKTERIQRVRGIETMYDRLVIDPPARKGERDARG